MRVLAVEFLGAFESLLFVSWYITWVNFYIYVSGIPPLRFALVAIYCDIREECKHIPGAERVYL